MRCVNRPHQDPVAMGTPQHSSHRGAIQTHSPEHLRGGARHALSLCCRHIKNEDFLKQTARSIAIQNEARICISHDTYAPVGPKRSVFMLKGSCPSPTRRLETLSTKGVGPQIKVFGRICGGKDDSARMAPSILRRYPLHPSGCLEVSVSTTRKSRLSRAIAEPRAPACRCPPTPTTCGAETNIFDQIKRRNVTLPVEQSYT
jgi:hypothetical protein